ncbi:MAG: hypothetical protein AAFX40_05745 [Cyanobacteria bacterium J06639_1]
MGTKTVGSLRAIAKSEGSGDRDAFVLRARSRPSRVSLDILRIGINFI